MKPLRKVSVEKLESEDGLLEEVLDEVDTKKMPIVIQQDGEDVAVFLPIDWWENMKKLGEALEEYVEEL